MLESALGAEWVRDSTAFLIYRFAGRDVLAVPDVGHPLRAAGVGVLPVVTRRARAYRSVLRTLVAAGVDRLVAERRTLPVTAATDFPWHAFVTEMERLLGADELFPVFLQARQRARGRAYVHLLARDGERIAFVKVATNATSGASLEREALILRALMGRAAETFRLPSLLAAGQFAGRHFLLLAPIPSRSQPHPPVWTPQLDRIRTEVAGPRQTLPSVRLASWWSEYVRASDAIPALARDLEADREVFTCARAHGDFVNWNVYVDGEDHWIFDWENHAEDAPVLTDRVRFELGRHTRELEEAPARIAPRLLASLGRTDPERRGELARALGFLHAKSVETASLIAKHWGMN